MPRKQPLTIDDRHALEQLWADAGTWIADTWTRLNAQCFDDAVPYAGVVWGLTPHGRNLGHCSPTGRITLHPALLNPQSNAWGTPKAIYGERYAADVLVHEMVHALFRARSIPLPPDGSGEHNTAYWCAEIRRITPLLGLPSIQAARITPRRGVGRQAKPGHLTHRQLATWPYTLRPKVYYRAGNHQIRVPM